MKRIISITLSALLLLSSTGINYATHFCGGHAVESSLILGQQEFGCTMPENEPNCEADFVLESEACCQNQFLSIEVEDDFKLSAIEKVQAPVLQFIEQPVFEIAVVQLEMTWNYVDNNPPPLPGNSQALLSTFLL